MLVRRTAGEFVKMKFEFVQTGGAGINLVRIRER